MKTIKILLIFFIVLCLSCNLFAQKNKSKKEEKKTMNVDFIHWYGQSAIRIEDGNIQIYIDPYKLPETRLPKADIILITHSHGDHFSLSDIEKIKKGTTTILLPADLGGKVIGNFKIVKPNMEYEIGKTKIRTIPAYNTNKKFHPKENNWVGYIVTTSKGVSVYHAGDTDTIPEMKELKIDIALMPIGGTYTMTASEAAEAVNTFNPKIVIPFHYGSIVGSESDAEIFKKAVKTSVVIIKAREK